MMEVLGAIILLGSNVLVALISHRSSLRKAKVDQTTQLLEAQNSFLSQVRQEYSDRMRKMEIKLNNYESHVKNIEDEKLKLEMRVHELERKIKELQREREQLLKKVTAND